MNQILILLVLLVLNSVTNGYNSNYGKLLPYSDTYEEGSPRHNLDYWENNNWAECTYGYGIIGFYRGDGDELHFLEYFKCAKPQQTNGEKNCQTVEIQHSKNFAKYFFFFVLYITHSNTIRIHLYIYVSVFLVNTNTINYYFFIFIYTLKHVQYTYILF